MEQTVLFLRHLDDTQVDDFVQHLTLCRVDFYIPSTKVVVINIHGIDCAVLVRLFIMLKFLYPLLCVKVPSALSFLITEVGANVLSSGGFMNTLLALVEYLLSIYFLCKSK